MKHIGAQNTKCILHISPYGITLALQATRSIIAQWPIKSIRCYESSGQGQLTIEAGRVAPMGEGVYIFQCQAQEDNDVYDLLDKYIMETLDRAQLTRRGTAQEIEDYHQEFNQLHSLTIVKPCLPNTTVIAHTLKDNWNHDVPGVILHSQQQITQKSREMLQLAEKESSSKVNSGAPPLPLPRGSVVLVSSRQSPNSRMRTTQPISIQNRPSPLVGQVEGEEPRLTSRPPPPPPRALRIPSNSNSLPRSSNRQRESLNSSSESPSARLPGHAARTPSSGFMSPGLNNWSPPPFFADVEHFSGQQSPRANSSVSSGFVKDHYQSSLSSQLDADSYLVPVNNQYLTAVNSQGYGSHGASHGQHEFLARQLDEAAGASWMASASCEDLSDHMKAVLYDNNSQGKAAVDENMNSQKPPKPFTGLQEFRSSVEWDPRDRSRSVDYHNVLAIRESGAKGYPSPSMRRIRKMMAAKGESESLRKSVSNPNFLNVGSLEKLNYEKLHGVFRPSSHGFSSTDDIVSSQQLECETRHKSRSLIDLLSSGLRRHLSRDKLDQSRNSHGHASPTHSGSSTPDRSRRRSRTNSLDKNGHKQLNRQESSKSITVKDPTFKDIRFTERTRSFRKVKSKDGTSPTEKKECASEKVKRRVFQKQKHSVENQANHFHLQNGTIPFSRQQAGYVGSSHGFVTNSASFDESRSVAVVHSRQHSAPIQTYREEISLPIGSLQMSRNNMNRAYDPVGIVMSRTESQSSV
ncbi:uncharacterized protein LOC121382805 isoform X2 [Gigantopelta aegis]|nr:uncharacterized protein LOC121382805 isoform X2 [Gigantopelta aegis]